MPWSAHSKIKMSALCAVPRPENAVDGNGGDWKGCAHSSLSSVGTCFRF